VSDLAKIASEFCADLALDNMQEIPTEKIPLLRESYVVALSDIERLHNLLRSDVEKLKIVERAFRTKINDCDLELQSRKKRKPRVIVVAQGVSDGLGQEKASATRVAGTTVSEAAGEATSSDERC
jgi:hypothetical protein